MNIAIISSHNSQNTADLQRVIDERENNSATVYALKDVAFAVESIDSHPFFQHDVYLFRAYNKSYRLAQILAQALARRGKLVVDAKLSGGFIASKFQEAMIYKDAQVAHIPTYTARNFQALQQVGFPNQYPVVVKEIDSQRGSGVRLCNDEAQLRSEIEQHGDTIIVQKFLTIDYDVRVICIGDEIVGAVKRESTSDDFRTNVSLGGSVSLYELSEEEASLAMRAHKAMGYDVSGVDIAHDTDGAPLVIETNFTPEWQGFQAATGIDVAAKIIDYVTERYSHAEQA